MKIRGASATQASLRVALAQISNDGFWNDEEFHAHAAAALPNYRLTKFQPLMPDWVEREVLQKHLLDIPGARLYLCSNDS